MFQLVARISLSIPLLIFSLSSQAQTTDICDRTSQIEAIILGALGLSESDCGSVPNDSLAKIGEIHASRLGISLLSAGDIAGLSGLDYLDLHGNDLASLPEDLFDGLSRLRYIDLHDNDLTSLEEDLFDGLSKLRDLRLHDNDLPILPKDVFDGLSSLEILGLQRANLTNLPEDVFDGLSSLIVLLLHNNDVTNLQEDVFDGLSNLEALDLSRNDHNLRMHGPCTTLPRAGRTGSE